MAPPKIGWLEIDSIPDGAAIYVDGTAVKLESGSVARTPIEQLTPLEFGRTYQIKIEKKGYKPHIARVIMGETTHRTLIKPVLEGYPSHMIVEVRGEPIGQDVHVFFNGLPKGTQRFFDERIPAGPMKITAKSEGWTCLANPESFTLQPSRSQRTTISCKKEVKRRVATRTNGRRRTPKKAGCNPTPGAPPGQVTLHVIPYADIYFRGKKLGQTPLNREKLPSGCVELKAIHPPTGKTRTFRVNVQPNRHDRYRFEL